MEYVGELVTKHFPRHGWFQGVVVEVVEVEGELYARVEYQDGDQEDLPLKELEKVLMFPEAVKKQKAEQARASKQRSVEKGDAQIKKKDGSGGISKGKKRIENHQPQQQIKQGRGLVPNGSGKDFDLENIDIPRRKRSNKGPIVVDLGPKFSLRKLPRMFWRYCWEQSNHIDDRSRSDFKDVGKRMGSPNNKAESPPVLDLSKCIDCGTDIKPMKAPRRCRSCYQKEYRKNRKKQKTMHKVEEDPRKDSDVVENRGYAGGKRRILEDDFQEMEHMEMFIDTNEIARPMDSDSKQTFQESEFECQDQQTNSFDDPDDLGEDLEDLENLEIADSEFQMDPYQNPEDELLPEKNSAQNDVEEPEGVEMVVEELQQEDVALLNSNKIVAMPAYCSFNDILSKTRGLNRGGNSTQEQQDGDVMDCKKAAQDRVRIIPELSGAPMPPPNALVDPSCPFADKILSVRIGVQAPINKNWPNLPGKCDPVTKRIIPKPSKIIGHLIQAHLTKLGNRVWYRGGHGRRLAEGWIVWNGILCSRCAHVVGATEFEKCAGMKVRKPGRHIIFPCGRSLLELTRLMEEIMGMKTFAGDLTVETIEIPAMAPETIYLE
ncbi:hypothetical protein BSKO_13516 [Bryopsis sp. KO-2023]|nr:hypothetical protein BSKO_13516 [Bryopsis sp. KO-2023]